jgi:hypothetical protein
VVRPVRFAVRAWTKSLVALICRMTLGFAAKAQRPAGIPILTAAAHRNGLRGGFSSFAELDIKKINICS